MITFVTRKPRASAFTLIELLVVIAIIAILAAILFPVFAKARESARGTASISNMKQISLGILMYVQDYDETMPMAQRWDDPASPIFWPRPWSSWAYDIAPYIKNRQIFIDPLYGSVSAPEPLYPLYSQYGYNYTALSPSVADTDPWIFRGTTLAAISRPSDCVLMAGHMAVEDAGGFWSGGPGTMYFQPVIDPPDCDDLPYVCVNDWSINGFYGTHLGTDIAGKYTGGLSLRKALNANLAHADGHVKFMQAGQAAIGSSWHKGVSEGDTHITDPDVYKWTANP